MLYGIVSLNTFSIYLQPCEIIDVAFSNCTNRVFEKDHDCGENRPKEADIEIGQSWKSQGAVLDFFVFIFLFFCISLSFVVNIKRRV